MRGKSQYLSALQSKLCLLQLLQCLLYSIVGVSGIANLLPVNVNDGRGAYCPAPQGTAPMENITIEVVVSVYTVLPMPCL